MGSRRMLGCPDTPSGAVIIYLPSLHADGPAGPPAADRTLAQPWARFSLPPRHPGCSPPAAGHPGARTHAPARRSRTAAAATGTSSVTLPLFPRVVPRASRGRLPLTGSYFKREWQTREESKTKAQPTDRWRDACSFRLVQGYSPRRRAEIFSIQSALLRCRWSLTRGGPISGTVGTDAGGGRLRSRRPSGTPRRAAPGNLRYRRGARLSHPAAQPARASAQPRSAGRRGQGALYPLLAHNTQLEVDGVLDPEPDCRGSAHHEADTSTVALSLPHTSPAGRRGLSACHVRHAPCLAPSHLFSLTVCVHRVGQK